MPTLKFPQFWRAQTLALFGMAAFYLGLVAFSVAVLFLPENPNHGVNLLQVLIPTTVVWAIAVIFAPLVAIQIAAGHSLPWLAAAKVLARLAAAMVATVGSFGITALVLSGFIPNRC